MRRAHVVRVLLTLDSCSASQASFVMGKEWRGMTGPEWLKRQYPDLGSKCVKTLAQLPSNVPFNPVR